MFKRNITRIRCHFFFLFGPAGLKYYIVRCHYETDPMRSLTKFNTRVYIRM